MCLFDFFFFFTSSLPNLIRAPESSQKNFATSKSLILPHTLWSVLQSCFPRDCAVLLIISFPLFSTFSPPLSFLSPLFFAVLTRRSASQGRRDSHSQFLWFFSGKSAAWRWHLAWSAYHETICVLLRNVFWLGEPARSNTTTLCWDNKETLRVTLPLHSRVNAWIPITQGWVLKLVGHELHRHCGWENVIRLIKKKKHLFCLGAVCRKENPLCSLLLPSSVRFVMHDERKKKNTLPFFKRQTPLSVFIVDNCFSSSDKYPTYYFVGSTLCNNICRITLLLKIKWNVQQAPSHIKDAAQTLVSRAGGTGDPVVEWWME